MTGWALGMADAQQENQLLVSIIEAISASPGIQPIAGSTARLIVAATATDVCFVHVLDDTGTSLTLAGATPPLDTQVGKVRFRLGEGVTGWVASHREPVVIAENKEADPRYRYIPELHGREFTSMASVPMACAPGVLVGVLNVHNRARREFSEHDIRLLTSIGSLVAGALHQARLHRQLEARERAQEQFVEHVIAVQEAERRRLAADMHDGISQRLLSLAFHLDAAAQALSAQPVFAAEQLERARELNDLTLDEARAAIFDLRPPVLDDLGLADGLASLARSVGSIEITVDADECPLPEHVEIALYRIAQEALQNVVKHSGARRAGLELRSEPKAVRLRVTDHGAGFDSAAAALSADRGGDGRSGYGLRSMTERAELVGGTLEVRSRPGRGTTVSVWVPVP
ncbi:MAG TPA: GAF domain-containing sensor histidine kinase [Streptosporangiaceae bacterium]